MGRFLQARGQGAPVPQCPRPPARFGCFRFHGAVRGANERGLRVVLCWAGSRQLIPKSCALSSLCLLLPGRQLPLQPWPPLALGPFGWCPGLWIHRGLSQLLHSLPTNRSSCLGTPAASLGCSQDSQSPPVLLLGPYMGELHALLSVLSQHLRHQLGLLQFSSILTLSPWRWCQSHKLRAQCHQPVHPT